MLERKRNQIVERKRVINFDNRRWESENHTRKWNVFSRFRTGWKFCHKSDTGRHLRWSGWFRFLRRMKNRLSLEMKRCHLCYKCVRQIHFEERSLKTRTLYNCKSKYLRNENYVMMCKEIFVRHPFTTCAKLTLKKDYLT